MKRKLTLEELAQVKNAHDEEGDVGALLALMKLMGMKDYHGEYEVQWRVNYDEQGGGVADCGALRNRRLILPYELCAAMCHKLKTLNCARLSCSRGGIILSHGTAGKDTPWKYLQS